MAEPWEGDPLTQPVSLAAAWPGSSPPLNTVWRGCCNYLVHFFPVYKRRFNQPAAPSPLSALEDEYSGS